MIVKRPTLFQLPFLGWREEVRLPQIGNVLLVAKVDTGARSAALHAENIVVKGKRVSFTLGDNQTTLSFIGTKRIKSSSGHSEQRIVIETPIEIGNHTFITEITLTDRKDMGVPMLLGRNTIKGRFLVNPARSFLISRKKIRT
jgi:hypothetical protein